MPTEITQTNGLLVHVNNEYDDRAIAAWWLGEASSEQKHRVHELIQKMHMNHHWLRCKCQPSDNRAYLAPVKMGDSYHLKRLPKRTPHTPDCIFWREPVVAADDQSIKSGASQNNFDPNPPSFLQESTGNALSNRVNNELEEHPKKQISQRTSRMASRLFWLAHTAGTQKHSPRPPVGSWLGCIEHVQASSNVPLKKLLFLSNKVWTEKWADSAFKLCEKNGLKPVCWWITVITGYDDARRILSLADANVPPLTIPVNAEAKIYAGDTSTARFPMLAILKLGVRDNIVSIQAMYAHPIISIENWMLVDSNLERKTYANLIEACRWLHAKHKIDVLIEKPIFNWGKTGERPDFVLAHQNRKSNPNFVIETMGYKNPEYLQRKEQMEENLPCGVFFDQRGPNDCFSKDIFNAVAKWALLSC